MSQVLFFFWLDSTFRHVKIYVDIYEQQIYTSLPSYHEDREHFLRGIKVVAIRNKNMLVKDIFY